MCSMLENDFRLEGFICADLHPAFFQYFGQNCILCNTIGRRGPVVHSRVNILIYCDS